MTVLLENWGGKALMIASCGQSSCKCPIGLKITIKVLVIDRAIDRQYKERTTGSMGKELCNTKFQSYINY